ncbi:MAG: PilZ domain-containing protein, partial [Planctomycetota bacterium]
AVDPLIESPAHFGRHTGPWTRVRLVRRERVSELEFTNASFDGLTIIVPRDDPAPPRIGEILHLLLDTRLERVAADVRAEVVNSTTAGGRLGLICSFRDSTPHKAPAPAGPHECTNRREAFRVSPKPGERFPVSLVLDAGPIAGWVVNVSASGMVIATKSRLLQDLVAQTEVRVNLTIPDSAVPLELVGTIVRMVSSSRPQFCAMRFDFPEPHGKSELERSIVNYVIRRQCEMIQLQREREG